MKKLSLFQTDIVWADPKANRQKAEEMMLSAEKSDVYVLPEMFSTGFATQPEGIAETADSDTLAWMKQMADRLDAAVCGSVAVEDGGKYYNRFYFVKPGGGVSVYDKKHLFTYGGEHLRFTAGDKPLRVEWRGLIYNICICYDLRFPIWSRNDGDTPYDVQIYVASWPETRRGAWDTLLRARAIENQCYVAAVNRVGDDPACHYNGGTCLIDPYGKTVAAAEDSKTEAITAEIDIEELNRFREKFPVLKDGEKTTIVR
ncbi:MAG: amidohydrolase [Bacteroidaceae bacterium]|nr:amidohydrolase [Bacteroidaceae bacterium]